MSISLKIISIFLVTLISEKKCLVTVLGFLFVKNKIIIYFIIENIKNLYIIYNNKIYYYCNNNY